MSLEQQQQPDEDSEYEYEYDETETETFYVNIDLTSFNPPLRPRRRRQAPFTSAASEAPSSPSQATSPVEPLDTTVADEPSRLETAGTATEHDNYENRIQIMELHSRNPLVSYGNQIFSCEWADMIGTDMHFTSLEEEPDPSYLKNGPNYSLIAANSVKIIGRRAHLISASASAAEDKDGVSSVTRAETNQSETVTTTNVPGKTAQVRFLQGLMDIKRAKGETDMMRMVYSAKRGQQFEERLTGWARTEERLNMIYQLNRDAIGGDVGAIRKLEELYDQIESGADVSVGETASSVTAEPNAETTTTG